MNLLKRNLLAAMLLAAFTAPVAALADEAAASPVPEARQPAAAADPADRIKLMQAIRARMHEMMHTQDADKRKALMEVQMKDMDALLAMGAPGPGMGMMMGQGMGAMGPGGMANCRAGQGYGMGMMGTGGKKPCASGNCPPRGSAVDHRLDALEKRMDMMQMMMQHMLRN